MKRPKGPENAVERTSNLALLKVKAASRKVAARKSGTGESKPTIEQVFKTPVVYRRFRGKLSTFKLIQAAPPLQHVPELSAEKRKLYSAFGGPNFSADVVVADFLERYGN